MTTDPATFDSKTWLLRGLALLGFAAMAFSYQWTPRGDRPNTEVGFAIVAAVAGLVVLIGPARDGADLLRRHPDLLVPFGCYLLLSTLCLLPLGAPAFDPLRPWTAFELAPLALALLVAMLLVTVTYAVWQVLSIARVVADEELQLARELQHSISLLPRGIGVGGLAFFGLAAPLALILWSGIGFSALPLLLIVVVGWSLLWGFLTVLWLPLALDRSVGFWQAIGNATDTARQRWHRWRVLLPAWALALGLITYHSYSRGGFGNRLANQTWHAEGLWYGGFPNESHWYAHLVDDAELMPLGYYALPLQVLFLSLAIAVKLAVLRRARD